MKNLDSVTKEIWIGGAKLIGVSAERIRMENRNSELHYYSVRHCDECFFTPASIELKVWVNHLCDVAFDRPLKLDNYNCIELTDEEGEQLLSAPSI